MKPDTRRRAKKLKSVRRLPGDLLWVRDLVKS